VAATDLWRKMLHAVRDRHPLITFADACARSPQQHASVWCTARTFAPRSSTPATTDCGLQTWAQSAEQHLKADVDGNQVLDHDKLQVTIDHICDAHARLNVIDINPLRGAKARFQRHRPVGLGIMAFKTHRTAHRLTRPRQRSILPIGRWKQSATGLLASIELALRAAAATPVTLALLN
jgi:ribonucleoside-diphosphate reductase alpha chain